MTRSHTRKVAQSTQNLQEKGAGEQTSEELAGGSTEEQMRAELERLEQANKVQRGFISVVSHEFRTTLAGIQGFSELLRDREVNVDKTKEYASIIYNDARRLDSVISDLLDLERMMVGQVTPDLEAVELSVLLTEEAEKAQEISMKHTIHLKFEQPLLALAADAGLLRQMMRHLLVNAIQYAPNGGEIWVGAQITAGMVHMVFHDQGVGIPEESLEEVFIPFRRLKTALTRGVRGAGLGLALVRQIVQLHHGKIWIESTVGEGSTVHISFPWVDPAHLEEEKKAE